MEGITEQEPKEYNEKRFTAKDMLRAFHHGEDFDLIQFEKEPGHDTPDKNLPFWAWLYRKFPRWQSPLEQPPPSEVLDAEEKNLTEEQKADETT